MRYSGLDSFVFFASFSWSDFSPFLLFKTNIMPITPASQDDYLMAIGKVVNNATLIESFMFTAFKILSGCSGRTANAIFYTHDTLQGKKSLLMRLVEVAGDDQDKALIKVMIKSAETANKQRQQISHAILVSKTPEASPPYVVHRPKSMHVSLLTKEWLSEIIRESHAAGTKSHRTLQSLCTKHRVPETPEL